MIKTQRLFEKHIRALLDARRPSTLLEIGIHSGHNTLKLLQWCAESGAHLTSLDPVQWEGDLPEEVKRSYPGYKYKRGQKNFENFEIRPEPVEAIFRTGLNRYWTCMKVRSLDYLASPQFTGFDVYLIDGDHNHYTVSNELRLIHAKALNHPVLLFNDVAGTWARKDQYYDPTFIPNEFCDGPKQGVLTAIEDFLDSISEKRLFWRVRCPYRFKMITRKHNGLGLLEHVGKSADV